MWKSERYKENIALYLESNETISYQQIAQSQKEIGGVLRGRTVAVLVCRNTLGCILCYLSLLRKDIVPLLLPSNLEELEVLQIAQVYGAKYLCCCRGYLSQNWNSFIAIEDYNIYEIPNWKKAVISKELALLFTTLGSTGDSRCVRLSKTNIKSNAASNCKYLELA